VERLVRLSRRHRSEVYADALREYVARHSEAEVTDSLNRALEEIGDSSENDRLCLLRRAKSCLKRTGNRAREIWWAM
jgi:hypothetical protein